MLTTAHSFSHIDFSSYPEILSELKKKHWFAEPDRPEHDPAAAALAWDRTLAFLGTHLLALG